MTQVEKLVLLQVIDLVLTTLAVCLVIWAAFFADKAKERKLIRNRPRHQVKVETTEERYVGTIYRYLRYGAHLNHARLGFRNKIEISKPNGVGGPENPATRISVMWGRRAGELHSVLDVDVDGDYVEIGPKGVRLPHPVPQQAKYNDEELNRLGFILADFAQHYFED